MSDHTIRLSLVGNRVHAEPNPLVIQPPINAEDTVTWIFEDSVGGTELKVEFKGARDLTPTSSPLPPFDLLGPLVSFSSFSQRRIVGRLRPDLIEKGRIIRHFYRVIKDGTTLDWENPVLLDDTENGGGIDIPGRPPGT